ncbi:MAG: DUF3830 family protein [bacterium]
MRLRIELPDVGVDAGALLYGDAAPNVTRLIYRSLATPLHTHTSHACFSGHQIFCFLQPFAETPPIENRTMRPQPGEIMFFHARPNELALMQEERLTGSSEGMYELAFNYSEVDLRHFTEEGLHGSLVGRVDRSVEAFAKACAATLIDGGISMRLSQELPRAGD